MCSLVVQSWSVCSLVVQSLELVCMFSGSTESRVGLCVLCLPQ